MAVRVAIIGCGGMARSHVRALRGVDGVEMVGVADRRAEAVASFAEVAPEAAGFEDAAQMLEETAPELVTVVTNGPSHAALTQLAARAGARWIVCEKPMATRLRDARAMIETCAERGTRLAINHTRRWSPAVARLRDALAAGAIGRPRTFLYTLGAGRLGCNGTHIVDQIRMLSGQDVSDVAGWIDTTGTPDPRGPEFRDPGAHCVMHLTDGTRVYLDQMEDLGVPPSLTIVGSIGQIRVEDLRGHWEVRARRAADRDKPMLAYGCPLEPVAFDVSDCPGLDRWDEVQATAYRNLLSDEPVACGGEDGYKAVEAVMAVHLSDQRGHLPQRLPLGGADLDFRVDFT